MAKGLEQLKEVSQSAGTVFVGLLVANGVATTAPLASMIPAMVHTIIGWVIAVGGVLGLVNGFTGK